MISFEKTDRFCQEILGVLLSLEKNGDFRSLYISKIQLSDLLAPMLLPKNSKASKSKQPNPFRESMIGDIRDLDQSVMTENENSKNPSFFSMG